MTSKRTRVAKNRRSQSGKKATTRLAMMCEYPISVNSIPDVVAQLRAKGVNGSFAILMFRSPEPFRIPDPNDVVNLQFSMENDIVGLDWVLLGPKNIVDKVLIAEFITRHGHAVMNKGLNTVDYLRVEDSEISKLGAQIVADFYKVDSDYKIGLMVDNVDIDLVVLGPPIMQLPKRTELPDELQYAYSTFLARCHRVQAKYHKHMAQDGAILFESEAGNLMQMVTEMEGVLNEFPSVIALIAEPNLYTDHVGLLRDCETTLRESLGTLRTHYKIQLFH